ncbi:MAG: DUF1186 domain-containing protein [Pseudomonadota bacterium]
MEVTEILEELEFNRGTFPRSALEAALANRDSMIPELLSVLETSVNHIDKIVAEPDYMLHLYAMYLLAQFREPRAYPLICEFFSLPDGSSDEAVGSLVTEDLCRILASVSCGDDSLIKSLLKNETLDEYVRSAAVRALVALAANGEKTRDEVISYFHELFNGGIRREYSVVWNSLVSCGTDLYPEELYNDIEQCYRDEIVDSFYMGLDEVQEMLERGKEEALRELGDRRGYTLITDLIRDMEWWACFKPPERPKRKLDLKIEKAKLSKLLRRRVKAERRPHEEPMRSQKIGRNEPCPCGSGKKYKKCCLLKGETNPFAAAPPKAVDELDELDALSNSVIDLIQSGELERAEEVCRQLLTRFPDQVDGLERTAMVCEAKGDRVTAAEYYRKTVDFMRSRPGFDEEEIAWMASEAERLDAEHETGRDSGGLD